MLGKILKYDFNYVRHYWWILAVSIAALSIIDSLVLRFVIGFIDSDVMFFLVFMGIMFLFVSIIAIFASLIVTYLLVYARFYKNFFTDEGYLTFTLPVGRSKLLLSKTLNSLIWITFHLLLIIVCVLLFVTFGIPSANGGFVNTAVLEAIGNFFVSAWETVGFWLIPCIIALIAIIEAYLLFSTSLVQLCITIGCIVAKKQKVLASIGIYYLVNMGVSFVTSILALGFGSTAVSGMSSMLADSSVYIRGASVLTALLIVLAIILSLACVVYFMTLSRLERKLNLA